MIDYQIANTDNVAYQRRLLRLKAGKTRLLLFASCLLLSNLLARFCHFGF